MATITSFRFVRQSGDRSAYDVYADDDPVQIGSVFRYHHSSEPWQATGFDRGEHVKLPRFFKTRQAAAESLIRFHQARAASAADNAPAPVPDGCELVHFSQLAAGDVVYLPIKSTDEGVIRAWLYRPVTVREVLVFDNGHGQVRYHDGDGEFGHLLVLRRAPMAARKITTNVTEVA